MWLENLGDGNTIVQRDMFIYYFQHVNYGLFHSAIELKFFIWLIFRELFSNWIYLLGVSSVSLELAVDHWGKWINLYAVDQTWGQIQFLAIR